MQIIYELDHNAYSPVRAHDNDAGFDLMCKEDQILEPKSQKFLKVIKLPSS